MKSKKRNIILNLITLFTLVVLAAFALRDNNLKMLQLRERVFKADESNTGLVEALDDLRAHVTTNMNSDLPKLGDEKAIQLKYSYERTVSKEQERYQNDITRLSQGAKGACLNSVNELSKVNCEQAYIKNNPVAELKKVYPEQYSIEFISPRWSFDLAGWLIIFASITGVALIIQVARISILRKIK